MTKEDEKGPGREEYDKGGTNRTREEEIRPEKKEYDLGGRNRGPRARNMTRE